MLTRQLLSDLAKLLNQYGSDSTQVDQYIAEHASDTEFVKLANLSRTLKRALSPMPKKALAHKATSKGEPVGQ